MRRSVPPRAACPKDSSSSLARTARSFSDRSRALRLVRVLALWSAGEAEADRNPSDQDGPAVPEEQDERRVRHEVALGEPFRTGQHGAGEAEEHDSRGHRTRDRAPDPGAGLMEGGACPGDFAQDDILAQRLSLRRHGDERVVGFPVHRHDRRDGAVDAPENLIEGVLDVPVDVDAARTGRDHAAPAKDVQSEVEGAGLPGRGGGLAGREGREDGDEDGRGDHRGRVDVPRDAGGKPGGARGDRGVPSELSDDRERSEEQERGDDAALVRVLASPASEIGGVRALVVGDRSGLPIVSTCRGSASMTTTAMATLALSAATKVTSSLNLPEPDDILIEAGGWRVLVQLLGNGFTLTCVLPADENLGLVKLAMQARGREIREIIDDIV